MRQLTTVLILILFGVHIYAYTDYCSVRVNIKNQNNEPVGFAIVHIINSNMVLQCDETANVELAVFPNENVRLHVSALGYKAVESEFKAVCNMQQLIVLQQESINLEEVTVRGSRLRDLMMKSSQGIINIDHNYIEQNFSGSLMQSLEGIPGVKAMNIGSGQSKPAIRGLGFNRMVVAENGVKHEGQQWGEG